MAKKSITVCDICSDEESVALYVIEGEGRLARLDLCEVHAEPLRAYLDLGEQNANAADGNRSDQPAVRRTPQYKEMVASMEEIEALVKDAD